MVLYEFTWFNSHKGFKTLMRVWILLISPSNFIKSQENTLFFIVQCYASTTAFRENTSKNTH
jgi:hypothetical protein